MTQSIKKHFPTASDIAYGCMGLGGGWDNHHISAEDITQARQVIDTAIESGINFFDHADIYTHGKAEQVFGKVLKAQPDLREHMFIQSKCGIRFKDSLGPGRYDFSFDWIQSSVDNILTRLHIEQLDVLMLHRPDPLMEPDEVAKVFHQLQQTGKVKHFGVSNMHQSQISFLQQHLNQPIIANQIEISLKNLAWLDEGVMVGNPEGSDVNFTSGTIEYCRTNKIQIQIWGSLCQGLFTGASLDNQPAHYESTCLLIAQLAEHYQCSGEAILLAWLMRHPANIQPIIGTTNLTRIKHCAQATKVVLSREHWYQLYVSARGQSLP